MSRSAVQQQKAHEAGFGGRREMAAKGAAAPMALNGAMIQDAAAGGKQ